MLEARVPGSDLRRTSSPLLKDLLGQAAIRPYVNVDTVTGERFVTGGLDVTQAPFHVVGAGGEPDPDIHAIGVAVDGTRWFTQVGTGRPGRDSPLCGDADAIAEDILREVTRWAAPDREGVYAPAPSAHLGT